MKFSPLARKTAVIASSATLLVAAMASPALAVSASTTGASGYTTTLSLHATDPLTDGHCARWQDGNGNWFGNSVCSNKDTVAFSTTAQQKPLYASDKFRICRTGVGNCSGWITWS